MNKKIIFQNKTKQKLLKFLKSNKKRKILNFLNQHDLYQLNNESIFKNSLERKEILNFIDGSTISVYLSLTNLKKIPRIRGPTFTKYFLEDKEWQKNKKHFFIIEKKEDIEKLKSKLPYIKKISGYSPPFIKTPQFSKKEIKKISNLINKQKPNYIWIGIGCPKQNILTEDLFKRTKIQYFFNIGAGIDFLLGKKQEAPKLIRNIGMEWLYRLTTDHKHTLKKVWRSLIGLKYLKGINLK